MQSHCSEYRYCVKRLLFVVFILQYFSSSLFSQTIKGKIIDANTKKPVSFAVISVDKFNSGATADLDGVFELQLPEGAQSISIQIIGYIKKTIPVKELTALITLSTTGIRLDEIVIRPGENPAVAIIRRVIKNKTKFNIDNLPHYICNTYAKTYFTFSDFKGNEVADSNSVDSSTAKLFKNSYLFFMESVTEKRYRYKNIAQEKVIASKVSGFKSAPFGAFASQLQSFTFYPDKIELLGLSYLSPLSKGTFKRYHFIIVDTVLTNSDTTILIKFYPKKNAKFKALSGVLYINKNQYVLANVIAEPSLAEAGGTGIKIQQLYQRIDSAHWFPKQLNTEILFSSGSEKSGNTIKGVSRMYVRDINPDSVFKIRNKNISAFNEEGFDQKKETFWKEQRVDSLNDKEVKTYRIIDSIGEKLSFDKKLKWFNSLSSGQFQWGYANIDLGRFLRLNDYEGLRLGLGLSTSDKFTKWLSIGAYGAYGFHDKAWKYGGHLRVNLDKRQTNYLFAEMASDVIETAGLSFLKETNNFLSTENIRNLMVSKMDKVNFAKMSFNSSVFSFVRSSVYFQIQQRESPFGFYSPENSLPGNDIRNFNLNEAGIQLKFWPKEKFTESMGKLISTGSKWPSFYVNLAKGLTDDVLGYKGTFEYTKLDFRMDHQINLKVKGFIAYQLQAGKVFGNVPYSVQYNNKGARNNRYLISVEKTFETMYLNEFISTEYVAFFFAINSGKIIKKNKYSNPEIELVHNYGIGSLGNRNNLSNIELNDIGKGFTEMGLRLKNIYSANFSALGIGVFYRYGNYAADDQSKNIVVKLVSSFSF